jgi:hypothetical protein
MALCSVARSVTGCPHPNRNAPNQVGASVEISLMISAFL